jgi:dTDP-4-dehydrorhamnose reductase
MKILLIGALGRLGKELARSLAPCGDIVWCVRPRARAAPLVVGSGSDTYEADVSRPHQLREVVVKVRPQCIVNAAAYTAVEMAEKEPLEAQAVNAIAPGVLAEAAKRLGAALVHYSTDYVFDGLGERAWREDDPTGPLNVYGRTKLAGEEAIRRAGADHLIIRTCWLYATHGQSFAKKMLDLASRQTEITMVSDQIGAPTSARLVANVTAAIIARSAGDPASLFRTAGGTLHVACAGETSWYGFAKTIFEQARELGLPVSIPTLRPIHSADRPSALARPLNSRLDVSRLAERFSLVPPSWETEFKHHLPALFAQYVAETGGANANANSPP